MTVRDGSHRPFLKAVMCTILTFFVFSKAAWTSELEYSTFEVAKASATSSHMNRASMALNNGPSFWSAPENLNNAEIISFAAYLKTEEVLRGVIVYWEQAPDEVQISTSITPQGTDPRIVRDWTKTQMKEVSFEEELLFDEPSKAVTIILKMRGVRTKTIGIRMIRAITTTLHTSFIVSGINSYPILGEQCLQVKGGEFKRGQTIVSDTCNCAIAHGDGRSHWRVTPIGTIESVPSADPTLCVGTMQSVEEEGVKPIKSLTLEPCYLMESSANGGWSFSHNGQLVSNLPLNAYEGLPTNSGGWCLTSVGPKAGKIDILVSSNKSNTAKLESDSIHPEHPLDNCVDDQSDTYWASQPQSDASSYFTTIIIDLGQEGENLQVDNIDIEWEYPALSYQLFGSSDGVVYVPVMKLVHANNSQSTSNELYSNVSGFRYYRLNLNKLHPEMGFPEDQRDSDHKVYLFGIIKLSLLVNSLELTVESCRDSANSNDARDKWFIQNVNNGATIMDSILGAEEALDNAKLSIDTKLDSLVQLLPQMESKSQTSSTVSQAYISLRDSTLSSMNDRIIHSVKSRFSSNHHKSGYSLSYPAYSCHDIKSNDAHSPSGWYYLLPPCAPRPIRGYCIFIKDKEPHLISLFNGVPATIPGTPLAASTFSSPDSVYYLCALSGMEPIGIRDEKSFNYLTEILQEIQFDVKLGGTRIPIAVDVSCSSGQCRGDFREFLDYRDVSQFINNNVTSDGAFSGKDIAYWDVETHEVVLDYISSSIGGVLCQSPHENGAPTDGIGTKLVDIGCHTTAYKSTIFTEGISASYQLRCPAGCETTDGTVYGSDGVYDQASSLCRAAVHNSTIPPEVGGSFSLTFQSPPVDGFIGSDMNGVESKDLEPHRRSPYAIRISSTDTLCPIDIFTLQSDDALVTSTSLLELNRAPVVSDTSSTTENTKLVTSQMNKQLKELYKRIKQLHGGASSTAFTIIKNIIDTTIHNALKYIKPVSSRVKIVLNGYEIYSPLLQGWLEVTHQLISTSESELDRYNKLSDEHKVAIESANPYKSRMSLLYPFNDLERSLPNPMIARFTGDIDFWYIEDKEAQTFNGTTPENLDLSSDNSQLKARPDFRSPSVTHSILISGGNFFDTEIYFNFEIDNFGYSSTIGVLFRYQDDENHYKLGLHKSEDDVLVIYIDRVRQGNRAKILRHKLPKDQPNYIECKFEVLDGVFLLHSHYQTISVQDSTFRSGMIGLFSSNLSDPVIIDKFQVKALTCQKSPPPSHVVDHLATVPDHHIPASSYISNGLPPLPPNCVIFDGSSEAFFYGVEYISNLQPNPSEESNLQHELSWQNIGLFKDKHDVLIQRKTRSPRASILLLRRPWGTCFNGDISVDMTFHTTNPYVEGGLVHNCGSNGQCLVSKLSSKEFGIYTVNVARNPDRIVGQLTTLSVTPIPLKVLQYLEHANALDVTIFVNLKTGDRGYNQDISSTIWYPVRDDRGHMLKSTVVYSDTEPDVNEHRYGLYGKSTATTKSGIDADISFRRLRAMPSTRQIHNANELLQ